MMSPAVVRFALAMLAITSASLCGVESNAQEEQTTISINATYYINPNGNARVRAVYGFQPPRAYDRLKRQYPNLYVLFRDFGVHRASFDINRSSLQVESDDGQRTITFRGDILGFTHCREGRWYLGLPRTEKIVTRVNNRIFTSYAESTEAGLLITGRSEYIFPQQARILEYAPDKEMVSFTVPVARSNARPKLDVHLRYKKRIMAAAYKIYADSQANNGAYWVAKLVVRNDSDAPAHDLRISYKLGEYTEESVPTKYTLVAPRGAVVDAYFPVISSRVAQLRSRAPVELRVKYSYRDGAGREHSDQLAQRIDILGINQFEFSNLSDEDRTDSWFDVFNNSSLLAGFVTKNCEAVRQFAGIISDAAGGADVSKPEGAIRWLKASYDQQMRNGIAYQNPATFLTTDMTPGQEVKFPRDTFRDKAGTCIDLAIAYCALAQSVGLDADLVLIPGHCFTRVMLPAGAGAVFVENTAFGGDKKATFEESTAAGKRKFAEAQQDGRLIVVQVARELSAGRVSNPELPPLPGDYLEKLGIRRRR